MMRILWILAFFGALAGASSVNNFFSVKWLFNARDETVTERSKDERSLCETKQCKNLAKILTESMNVTADPCEDFYEYACGNWKIHNPLPDGENRWNLLRKSQKIVDNRLLEILEQDSTRDRLFAVKYAKRAYKACMDIDEIEKRGLQPIVSTLWRIGGWPLIMEEDEWDAEIYKWQNVDNYYAHLIGLTSLFDIRVGFLDWNVYITSLLIDTPHLPYKMYKLLRRDEIDIEMDSSDENNDSREGSQERGSEEKRNSNEDEDDENDEDYEDEEEMQEKRIARKRISEQQSLKKRKYNKIKGIQKHINKQKKGSRTKREVTKPHGHNEKQHKQRKVNSHIVHRDTKKNTAKLLNHEQLALRSHTKKSVRKTNLKSKRKKEHTNSDIYFVNNDNEEESGFDIVPDDSSDEDTGRNNDSSVIDKNDGSGSGDSEWDDNDGSGDSGWDDDDNSGSDNNDDDDSGSGNNDDDDSGSGNNDDEGDDEDNNEEDENDAKEVEKFRQKYAEYMLNVSSALAEARGVPIPKERLVEDINELMKFQLSLLKIMLNSEDEMNTTLRAFQKSYDALNRTTNKSKRSMNETVDPCDDFYEYACGQWANNNPSPENVSSWSLWSMVQKRIDKQVEELINDEPKPDDIFAIKLTKKWYQSCMDIEAEERRGVEPVLSTLWRHGGWPLIMEDGEWDSKIYNWQIVDDHFARLLGFNAFHDIRYDSISYEDDPGILIETPHLPIRLHRLLKYPTPPSSDSSDENNESGEGSQEKGSKERGNNKEDDDDENNKNEDSGYDEDDSNDSENNEISQEDDEEKLQKKKVTERNHKRIGHQTRNRHKNKIGNKHISETKTRKRTKRDITKAKILHRLLHALEKLKKHKNHHIAKKGKGKLSKHGHLSVSDNTKTSVAKNHAKNEERHNVASSTKNVNKNNKKDVHEGKKEQRKDKLAKKKNNKRLGHDKKRSNKSKVARKHVHERKTKIHVNERHKVNKIPNHRTHLAGKRINVPKHRSADNTEDNSENEEENNNDKNDDTKEGDDEENDENHDENDEEDDNDSEDENKEGDEEDNNSNTNNEEEDDDEEDDDEEDNDSNANNEEEDDDEEDDNEEDNNEEDDDEENDEEDEEAVREKLKEKYREYILNVSLILAEGRGVKIPKERLEKDIADLVEFAVKLGELTVEFDDDPVNTTLDHFQEAYDDLDSTSPNNKINWKRKVQKLFEEAGVDLEDDVEITVTCQTYIRKLKELLDKTSSETIVNYIHWLFVDKMAVLGPAELKQVGENWIGDRIFDSREEQCVQQVEMSNIMGYIYVKKHFSDEIARTARDMIDDIQKEVEYQIKGSVWMDDDTKHFILDKLVAMKNMVGHPDWYQNTTAVRNYFQGLTIGPSYYENILNYIRHTRWKMLRKILEGASMDGEDYVDPLMLNAFFIPTENSITITAADFQNPFFALNRPWNINYGIIGVIMGHEVNHGFDDEGHLYDRQGRPMEWLSAMAEAYNKRADCFIDQFNKYPLIKGENFTIENYGKQTAGENIADTMGLQAVYKAYRRRQRECKKPDPALPGLEKFSNDQIFFLSFANLWCEKEDPEYVMYSAMYDVHSPARLRVIGSVSNSEDFAKVFNCPVGSPMNPERKCNIWQ
ncbi:uncharacterized protein LOC143182696 [Calliopsis andreniformis]|uniref:uncharacterized protein LOC143182696 n=1 Tax=Calliopsis andreniformis TaxID=337506 RepID=UPI003FCE0232